MPKPKHPGPQPSARCPAQKPTGTPQPWRITATWPSPACQREWFAQAVRALLQTTVSSLMACAIHSSRLAVDKADDKGASACMSARSLRAPSQWPPLVIASSPRFTSDSSHQSHHLIEARAQIALPKVTASRWRRCRARSWPVPLDSGGTPSAFLQGLLQVAHASKRSRALNHSLASQCTPLLFYADSATSGLSARMCATYYATTHLLTGPHGHTEADRIPLHLGKSKSSCLAIVLCTSCVFLHCCFHICRRSCLPPPLHWQRPQTVKKGHPAGSFILLSLFKTVASG